MDPVAENENWKFNIMKKYQSVLTVGLCAGALCAGAAHAENGFYAGADAGGLLTLDTRIKEFVGPAPGAKMELDPGFRLGLHGGYRLCDFFSVEGETGIMGNNIKSIPGAFIDGNATLANVPFKVNARFELPLRGHCPITPYFGGGAGGSATILSFEHHIDFNGTELHGTDSDVVAAYQAFGGIRYAINDHMDVGVEYHYFATTGASYSVHDIGTPNKIGLAGVQSHAITAAFNYRF
jgi:opacity protein-like surface antigen